MGTSVEKIRSVQRANSSHLWCLKHVLGKNKVTLPMVDGAFIWKQHFSHILPLLF